MSIDISEYKALYIKTSRELIRTLQAALIQLEKNNCDQEAIATIHRGAHSLKGQSLVMGHPHIGLATKTIEQLFHDISGSKQCVDTQILPLLSQLFSRLEESINSIEQDGTEFDLTTETEQLTKLLPVT